MCKWLYKLGVEVTQQVYSFLIHLNLKNVMHACHVRGWTPKQSLLARFLYHFIFAIILKYVTYACTVYVLLPIYNKRKSKYIIL